MCLTIEDGLLSLLTILSFKYHPTHFANKMSKYGLIPNEVKDDVHRINKTGKLTYHCLRCRVLLAVNDFVSSNKKVGVQQVVKFLESKYRFEIGIGIRVYFMKDYLCKLVCVRVKGMGLIYNVYSTTSTNSTSISIS